MNLLLRALDCHLPEHLRRRSLLELAEITADAFNCPVPEFEGLSSDECLRRYAEFTRDRAELVIADGSDLRQIQARLHAGAFRLGSRLRQQLRVSTMPDVMSAARLLYRGLCIDFHGGLNGDVVISNCFFSQFYSSDVCNLISALDDGFMAGLAGGGRLIFSRRITEGHEQCRACFRRSEHSA